MRDIEINIDKEIVEKYDQRFLNIINKKTNIFVRNFLKFSILRYDVIKEKFRINNFLREMRKLKNNDNDLHSKKEIFELIDTYLGVSETEKKQNGEVFTPMSLINSILDKLPVEVWSNPDLTFNDNSTGIGNFIVIVLERLMNGLKLTFPNEKERYKHIMENMIYTCDIENKNSWMYINIFDPDNELKLNHYQGSFLEDGFNEHMENVWKLDKFDITVANPPYNQSIDLKFLEKSYGLSDKVVFVHPATWLIDEKNKQKKFIKVKELIKDDLVSTTLFNGNVEFGINLFVPCSITYINKDYSGKIKVIDDINNIETEYKDINKINKFNTDEYFILKNKIFKFTDDNIWEHQYCDGNYFISMSQN